MKIQKISLFLLCLGTISAICGMEADLAQLLPSYAIPIIKESPKEVTEVGFIHSLIPKEYLVRVFTRKPTVEHFDKTDALQVYNPPIVCINTDQDTLHKLSPDTPKNVLSTKKSILFIDVTDAHEKIGNYAENYHQEKIKKEQKEMHFWNRYPKTTFFGLGLLTCGLMLKAYNWWKSPIAG